MCTANHSVSPTRNNRRVTTQRWYLAGQYGLPLREYKGWSSTWVSLFRRSTTSLVTLDWQIQTNSYSRASPGWWGWRVSRGFRGNPVGMGRTGLRGSNGDGNTLRDSRAEWEKSRGIPAEINTHFTVPNCCAFGGKKESVIKFFRIPFRR